MAVDFGRDTSCTTGRRTGRLSSGPRLVGEAIFRRLSTPRGRLRGGKDEQNYGLDLTDLVGQCSSKAYVASLPGLIQTECEKDTRLIRADVTVTATVVGPTTTLDVVVVGITSAGPFTLRLAVSEVTVALLGLDGSG